MLVVITGTMIPNIFMLTKISMLETPSDSLKLAPGIGIGQVQKMKTTMAHLFIIVILRTLENTTATGVLDTCLMLRFRVQMDI